MIDSLLSHPERFDFVQAVRLLERAAMAGDRDRSTVSAGYLGVDTDPRGEALLLRTALELGFPATEVAGYDAGGKKPALTLTLMGLVGVSGVLPGHYARLVLETARAKNSAPRDFFDMFNHRALSLFLRAADKYRLPLAYERARTRGTDAISGALRALIGMRGPAMQARQALPDAALLYYAGHFSHRPRTAGALGQMLSDYFDRPVGIKQFQGHWANLELGEQTRLSKRSASANAYAALGSSAVLGTRVWDVQGSFRIKLGPLDYEAFRSFMPGAAEMNQLVALTRSYVGAVLRFDVQLTLKAVEIPALTLSSQESTGARLGWNTWLPSSRPRGDASDAVFAGEAV